MAYAQAFAPPRHRRQHTFVEPVQDDAAVEAYTAALSRPLMSATYGSRVRCGSLSMLARNVDRGTNAASSTTVRLAFGTLALCGLDEARKAPRVLDALICAKASQPDYSIDDLHLMETEIESLMNPVQMAFMRGDKSKSRQIQLLELVNKSLDILQKMKAALERSIYGRQS